MRLLVDILDRATTIAAYVLLFAPVWVTALVLILVSAAIGGHI